MVRDGFGLRMGHKLREVHINLNPRSRMRVNLAAQVYIHIIFIYIYREFPLIVLDFLLVLEIT